MLSIRLRRPAAKSHGLSYQRDTILLRANTVAEIAVRTIERARGQLLSEKTSLESNPSHLCISRFLRVIRGHSSMQVP